MIRIALLLALALTISAAPALAAPIPGVSLTGFQNTLAQNDFTDGWRFSTSVPLNVISLGFQDIGGNGLNTSHPVGIWTDSGTLLGSVVVTPAATLGDANFRYVTIPDLLLPPGTYRIGAEMVNQSDPMGYNPTAFATAPGITFLGSVEKTGSGFGFPNNANLPSQFNQGLFGPNFQFSSAMEAPEPISLLTWGLASAAGMIAARHRRKTLALEG
jgi:hypothetical protein